MKKILLSMLVAIVALTSCQKDDLSSSGDGREVAVSIAASLPTTMTRSSEQGGIDNVDWTKYSLRYTLEIYEGETILPVSKVNAATQRVLYKESLAEARTASFDDIRLLSGKEYQFVIWADFVNKDKTELRYSTQEEGGLTKIKRNQLRVSGDMEYPCVGSVDYDDAYFATEKVKVESSLTQAIALKRPFGKVRVITTDIKEIVNAKVTEQTPVYVNFGPISAGFNAFNGSIDAATTGEAYATTIKELTDEQGTLFYDYILVPATTITIPVQVPFKFKVECLGATYEMTTDAVKLERNKLTTVKGKLLTKGVNIDITIKDEFLTPGIEFEVPIDVATVAAAQVKLDAIDFAAPNRPAAPISVRITNAIAGAEVLNIPAAATITNTTQIQIDLAAGIASNKTFTLKQATENGNTPAYTGIVYVIAPASTEGNLIIDMPSATVYVNGKIKQLTSTVSKNTLIIDEKAEIETLTMDKGETIIYGKVTNLNFTKALFEIPYTLPEPWDLKEQKGMTMVRVYDRLLTMKDSNIDGIASDSIPESVYFHHYHLSMEDEFSPGFVGTKYNLKSHWFTGMPSNSVKSNTARSTAGSARVTTAY